MLAAPPNRVANVMLLPAGSMQPRTGNPDATFTPLHKLHAARHLSTAGESRGNPTEQEMRRIVVKSVLEPSNSLPTLPRSPRRVVGDGNPYGAPCAARVKRVLDSVLAYAEDEMRIRRVPPLGGGYSKARLDVWREALGKYCEQLPNSQAFLLRFVGEVDEAIAGLKAEIEASEKQISTAWFAAQRAEELRKQAQAEAEASRLEMLQLRKLLAAAEAEAEAAKAEATELRLKYEV